MDIILILIIFCSCISLSTISGLTAFFVMQTTTTTTAVPTTTAASFTTVASSSYDDSKTTTKAPTTSTKAPTTSTKAPTTTPVCKYGWSVESVLSAPKCNLDGKDPFVQVKISNTNKCIGIRDRSKDYGAEVISLECLESDDSQKFELTEKGQLITKHSGRCLFPYSPGGKKFVLSHEDVEKGSFVSQGLCSNPPHWSEKWSYDPNTKLIKFSGSNKCLALLGGDGNNIGIWDCDKNSPNQLFEQII
jgi:hypothetical protein